MTKIFYDTEFLEDGHNINLISIGMVAENGDDLYLINKSANWNRIIDHDWHLDNTLPYLDFNPITTVSYSVISVWVREFVLSFPEPELWAWYGAYDHIALCQLYGSMRDLPEGFPWWTNDLRQEYHRLGVHPDTHKVDRELEHHALADAKDLKRRYDFLLGEK